MANTYGRQVVIPLTNKSGGSVAAGDVVIIDTSNNDAFTTSTAGAVTGGVGIAQETIASNAVGRVLISGYAALVNVNASVTRGNYGKTYTVVKQATDAGSSRVTGTFCQFLTGGTTPDALVYPVDLAGTALTNPMTTAGDIIYGGASGVPTRLAGGTSTYVLTSNGATSAPSWQASAGGSGLLAVTRYNPGSDNAYAVTGTSLADLDATNAIVTFTAPASGNVYITVDVLCGSTANGGDPSFILALRESSSTVSDLQMLSTLSANIERRAVTFYVSGVSGGSHTYKLAAKLATSGGTGTIYYGSTERGGVNMAVFAAP